MEALQNLGIDFKGILIYLVNFGVIVWILSRYAFKPLVGWMDKRRETIERNLNEAEELRISFEKMFAQKEAEVEARMRELENEVVSASQQAQKQAQALLEEAEVKKMKLIQEARMLIGQMKENLHKEVEEEIMINIQKIVLKILKDADPKEVEKSIASEWKVIKEA